MHKVQFIENENARFLGVLYKTCKNLMFLGKAPTAIECKQKKDRSRQVLHPGDLK